MGAGNQAFPSTGRGVLLRYSGDQTDRHEVPPTAILASARLQPPSPETPVSQSIIGDAFRGPSVNEGSSQFSPKPARKRARKQVAHPMASALGPLFHM